MARGPEGYARLARAITRAQLQGHHGRGGGGGSPAVGGGRVGAPVRGDEPVKGRPVYSLSGLADVHGGHWRVLTGCRKGTVPAALEREGPAAAARALADLVAVFGRDSVAVEIWDHGGPTDSVRNDVLVSLACDAGVDVVATNNVHYATPAGRRLAGALAAVRARRSLDEADPWLPVSGAAHLRSGAEQARRFSRWPGAVEAAARIGAECAFDLKLVAPRLPDWPVPEDHTEMSWLRHLTEEGATRRYGRRGEERVPGAWAQIDRELEIIEQLGFPGYFLVVWDIVQFCRNRGILCQGRGSAANSAVCYALGVTAADAVSLGLLFERFLSPARDGPPDIDIDIESDRREEAIQYVYERYGRENAALVANVISYRPRSALRDAGKALGHPQGQLDAWSKQLGPWGPFPEPGDIDVPGPVLELAAKIHHLPRHLGIHPGGMVICDRPVSEVCPVEWGRMKDRTVLQWDKDDCAAVGLVKFDLLGLGMLSALNYCLEFVRDHHGVEVDLATLPQEDEVYDMLCAADSIGVFQVESRAQMATLPRLRPRTFYDIVVEVALIRPGPIQGGSVHPYIRRRNGAEPVTYLHPLLEPALKKTLGVPLFQEQLMQMAIDVAGFSASEADQLRQAMGSKRSGERMERLRGRFYEGMAVRGISGETADAIWDKLAAFANFGFPESHSVSFAYLVYSSAWFKLHYPAAFCAALLKAQPMGFYSPQTLVADARRHGVEVRGPDVNASDAAPTLEPLDALAWDPAGVPTRAPGVESTQRAYLCPLDGHKYARKRESTPGAVRSAPDGTGAAVRLGLSAIRGIGSDLAQKIEAVRDARGPFVDMADVASRAQLSAAQVEALATAGAFGCFQAGGARRRDALWAAGAVAQAAAPEKLDGIVVGADAPPLDSMTTTEEMASDIWATGIAVSGHPVELIRSKLDAAGVLSSAALAGANPGDTVKVGGVVTHRQRPSTAGGTTFLNLEDETGMVNIICSPGAWARHRKVAGTAAALIIRGRLERAEGVTNVVAETFTPLHLPVMSVASRDFR
ncbi:MAG TPA: error-prone DNA polymerase [Acidimicrobiales bacterium]|nr:error-prone DNA polymerase [Acidimicrobiales bacterium]